MDPVSMDGYGYGNDDLDSKFSKYTFNQNNPQQPAQQIAQQQYVDPNQQQYIDPNQQQGQQQYTDQQYVDPQQPPSSNKFADKFNESFNLAFPNVKKNLLFAKAFYFFFYAAFGSLFPLIGVYFKQLGMSPCQTGLLIGLRPFVELFAGPFWGNLAERWKKWKLMLLGSLTCWFVFTVCLAFVQPTANSCLIHNGTNIFVARPYTIYGLRFENMASNDVRPRLKRSVGGLYGVYEMNMDDIGIPINAQLQSNNSHTLYRNNHRNPGNVEYYSKKVHDGHRFKRSKTKKKSKKKSKKVTEPPPEEEEKEEEKPEVKQETEAPKVEEQKTPEKEEIEYDYYKIDDDEPFDATKHTQQTFYQFNKFPYPAIDIPGLSPLPLNHRHIANLESEDVKGLVSPPLSAVVYRERDITSIFLILLILQIIGEFLSTPAINLADTATLGYLQGKTEDYGKQRIYGSLGWAVSMFFVGIALDYSNIFSNHPCGTEHVVDRNYMTCYAVFGILMLCALGLATRFKFREVDSPIQVVQLQKIKEKVVDTVQTKFGVGLNMNGTAPHEGEPEQNLNTQHEQQEPIQPNPVTFVPRGRAGRLPQLIGVLKMFAPIQYSSMFFILWFSGFGVGLVFAFLFWHLQDIGGTPTLFGIASVVNHLSELVAFFFIKKVVAKLGHLNVVYIGLGANVVRFILISYISRPWFVLPLEFFQGLTHAAVWASGVSYMTQTIPEQNRSTAQMILQSLHLAVGRGCGTVIGGIFINSYGTASVFRGYGVTCLIVTLGYIALNVFFISKLPPVLGAPPPSNDVTADAYLTPHGVPGSTVSAHDQQFSQQNVDNNPFGNNQQEYYTDNNYNNNNNYNTTNYDKNTNYDNNNYSNNNNYNATNYDENYGQNYDNYNQNYNNTQYEQQQDAYGQNQNW